MPAPGVDLALAVIMQTADATMSKAARYGGNC
jgi:hypothetical protein